jgi:hypothetical protein
MSYLPRGGSFPWRSVWKVKVPFASEVSSFFLFFFFFFVDDNSWEDFDIG